MIDWVGPNHYWEGDRAFNRKVLTGEIVPIRYWVMLHDQLDELEDRLLRGYPWRLSIFHSEGELNIFCDTHEKATEMADFVVRDWRDAPRPELFIRKVRT